VTSEDATNLLHLRSLWQEAYAITLSEGIWTARSRYDPAHSLTASTASDLRWQIRNDYGEWLRTKS
jgi:hypothetical protein